MRLVALIIILLIILVISQAQINFTFDLWAGNFYGIILGNSDESINRFAKVFSKKRISDFDINRDLIYAYGKGIIESSNWNSGRNISQQIDDKNREMLLSYFPDNIFFNYLFSEEEKRDFESLDEISLAIFSDHSLNEISKEVITKYFKKNKFSLEFISTLANHLKWDKNIELAGFCNELLNEGMGDKNSNESIEDPTSFEAEQNFHCSADHMEKIEIGDIPKVLESLLFLTLSEERMNSEKLLELRENEVLNHSSIIKNLLVDNVEYRDLERQFKEISHTVEEMGKIYKVGYPKFRKTINKKSELELKLSNIYTEFKKKFIDTRTEEIQVLQSRIKELNSVLRKISYSSSLTIIDLELRKKPTEFDFTAIDLAMLLNREPEIYLSETFSNKYSETKWDWINYDGYPDYGKGSIVGEKGVDHFLFSSFFLKKEKEKKYPWAKIQWNKNIPIKDGIYLQFAIFKSMGEYITPHFSGLDFTCRKGDWVIAFHISVNNEKSGKYLYPNFGIKGIGSLILSQFGILKLSSAPIEHFQDIFAIVYVENKHANVSMTENI